MRRAPDFGGCASKLKHLIVTGDDFGRSSAINEAVEASYLAGFLTQASLMVHESAADEAVRIARRHPGLRVGLHLTLCAGRASCVSALTDAHGAFAASPARAGLRYFCASSLVPPLREEIAAQFGRFRALNFPPGYWDGHTHLHLHPTILRLTLPLALAHGFRATRLVRSSPALSFLPLIFHGLSAAARPRLRQAGVRFTERTFGLSNSGQMTTARLAALLAAVPPGRSELYFHPGAERGSIDFAALARQVADHGISLTTSVSDVS